MNETYTIRMGFFDTSPWNSREIVDLYKSELSKAGFVTSQFPTIFYPKISPKILLNNPFQGAKSISFNLAPFGDFQQTRDTNVSYEKDPAKLAEVGIAFANIFTWNVCSTDKVQGDPIGILRDIFRRVKPDGVLKLSPKISKFNDASLTLNGYPEKQSEPQCNEVKAIPKGVKVANTGLWTLLFGLGVSLLTKGKV